MKVECVLYNRYLYSTPYSLFAPIKRIDLIPSEKSVANQPYHTLTISGKSCELGKRLRISQVFPPTCLSIQTLTMS